MKRHVGKLTEEEFRVLRAASHGLWGREIDIFETLNPPGRANTVMQSIRRKLGAKNTAHAVAIGLREGKIN